MSVLTAIHKAGLPVLNDFVGRWNSPCSFSPCFAFMLAGVAPFILLDAPTVPGPNRAYSNVVRRF